MTGRLIDGLLARGKTIHLVSHVITSSIGVEDDYGVCCEIKERFKDNSRVILAPRFISPISAKIYISQMEFFVGARMHATIAALSAGVPTVPVAYSRKFSGVFGTIGYDYTLEAYGESNTDGFLARLLELYDSHLVDMNEARELAVSNAHGINAIYRNFLLESLK